MADSWEKLYFGDGRLAAPNEDRDGDGATNLEEYVSGTNPADSKA